MIYILNKNKTRVKFVQVVLEPHGGNVWLQMACTIFYVWSLISIKTTIYFKYVFNTD